MWFMVMSMTPTPYLSPRRSLSFWMISSSALRCFSWIAPDPIAVIGSRPGPLLEGELHGLAGVDLVAGEVHL